MRPLTPARWVLLLAVIFGRAFAADPADSVFLFSYFVRNGEDGLHLAVSEDGLKWTALRDGASFLTPVVGENKLMRDPCLLLGPDGVFRMVWTTSWTGMTIGYASSTDLRTWSEQKALPVMAHELTTANCWAPEIIYDAAQGHYLISGRPPCRENSLCPTKRTARTRPNRRATTGSIPRRQRILPRSRRPACTTNRAAM